jgi:hypothetical protein
MKPSIRIPWQWMRLTHPGDLLLQYCRLGSSQLRIGEVPRLKLARGDQPIKGLIPSWHAVCSDYG